MQVSYDYEIADRALPHEKIIKFELSFMVNEKGKVEKVKAKANHRAIAIEAIRTAKRLPKFKVPGMLNGSPIVSPVTLKMIIEF